jgi:hypothetical protein
VPPNESRSKSTRQSCRGWGIGLGEYGNMHRAGERSGQKAGRGLSR